MAPHKKEDEQGTLPPPDEFIDNPDFSGGYFGHRDQAISFKDIVLRAIETCRKEGSKEMVKGGQKMVFSKELNDWVPFTLPDQRKVYQQTINQLYDLLIWYFDEKANEALKKIDFEIKNSYKKHYEEYLKRESWEPYQEEAQRTGMIVNGPKSNVGAFMLQQHEEHIFQCYRKIYQELILLYKRRNELSNKRILSWDDE